MRVLALAAVLGLALASNAAAAQPGTLDRTFGGDGRVETRLLGGPAKVAGVAVTREGRILVGGTAGDERVVLVRYRRDGRLDRSFGSGGVAEHVLPDGVVLHDMIVDASGRVLLGGSVGRGASGDAAVLRLLPRGALDAEFGLNGVFRLDLGGAVEDFVSGLVLRGDGRIVAAASVANGDPIIGSWTDLAVLRLHGDGGLDRTFGEQGLTRMAGTWTTPYSPGAVAIEPDGHVLVGVVAGYTPKMAVGSSVLRLTPDGAADAPFGGSQTGMSQFSLPGETRVRDIAFDASAGRVMVAGSVSEEDGRTWPFAGALTGVVLEGYGAGNVLAYGDGGGRMLDRRGHEGIAEALVLDRRGSALIAGGAFEPSWKRSDLLVARVDRSGRVDGASGERASGASASPSGPRSARRSRCSPTAGSSRRGRPAGRGSTGALPRCSSSGCTAATTSAHQGCRCESCAAIARQAFCDCGSRPATRRRYAASRWRWATGGLRRPGASA